MIDTTSISRWDTYYTTGLSITRENDNTICVNYPNSKRLVEQFAQLDELLTGLGGEVRTRRMSRWGIMPADTDTKALVAAVVEIFPVSGHDAWVVAPGPGEMTIADTMPDVKDN